MEFPTRPPTCDCHALAAQDCSQIQRPQHVAETHRCGSAVSTYVNVVCIVYSCDSFVREGLLRGSGSH